MDAELIQGVTSEALSYIPEMREHLSEYFADRLLAEKLENVQKRLNTVKGAASMIGFPELSFVAADLLSALSMAADYSTVETKISEFEAFLSEVCANIDTISPNENELNTITTADDFGDFAIDDNSVSSDDSFEEFEIDEEMLEVFAMEAQDNLQNIGENLELLEKNPNNREALLEIRRNAHTIKGSAGIVGFKTLSSLAHRMEDLLDYISDNEIESNQKIFEFLLASTDCLEAFTREKNSSQFDDRIIEINQRFDEIMASLHTTEVSQVSAVSDSKPQENTMSQEELVPPYSTFGLDESAETAENLPQTPNPDNRSVIRVSIERLDYLVKVVSEMVITRSTFEQRLAELEQQIQELNHTTSRLRKSTGKLEVDFEAKALNGNNLRSPRFSFSNRNLPSALSTNTSGFDSLEFDHYTDFHQTTRELIEATGDTSAIHNDLDNLYLNLSLLFDNQRHLIDDMQDNLLRLRMVPLHSLTARLQRTVKVTAKEEDKLVDLVMENDQIEIDTQILDTFVEPLIHILRNAVAHGIESPETRKLLGKSEKGKITFRAYSEGTHIVFVIADDGRGISATELKNSAIKMGFISENEAAEMSYEDALSLIFLPGLSTAAEINQISGRGVGMNVVKSNITRRHGNVFISSKSQQGTTFTIRLPMALAVTRALLIKANDQTFAIPLKLIKKVVEISSDELAQISAEKSFTYGEQSYHFSHFNQLLNLSVSNGKPNERAALLLIESSDNRHALKIDEIIKPEEIVIKPLGTMLQNVPEIIGATILGNGNIVPVLDLIFLLKKKPAKIAKSKAFEVNPAKDHVNILIVDDSPSVRRVNSKLIQNAGWIPILAKDGIEALEVLQNSTELPDVILTDVEMPKMDGYELLASTKRHETYSHIPVIMITSRSGDKHRRKALDLGVSEYLSKPFEENHLIETIRNLLG